MKKYIRKLNKDNGNVFEKAKFLKTELKRVELCLDKDPHNALLREEKLIYSKVYHDDVVDEERLMKHKSMIEWLREDDHNSAYFHRVLKGKNDVKSLIRDKRINMIAIIETQLRKKSVNPVCKYLFGSYSWVSNAVHSRMGFRDRGMEVFRDCMQNLEVEDLNSFGMFYTWIEKRKNPNLGILKKLDSVMVNEDFVHNFGGSYANFLPYLASDHYPALLVLLDVQSSKPKSFRLKNMKKYMRKLNKDNGPHNALLREEKLIYSKVYHDDVVDEERLMKQKSMIEWLREDDHNSAYFHRVLKGKKFLECEEYVFTIEDCDGLFVKKLDPIIATIMIRPVLDEEIRDAMFGIKDDKAAGPDGFTSKFFKKHRVWLGLMCAELLGNSSLLEFRQISDNILLTQELMFR
nr:hypothetical protein [Tanacetum cinerariifolium]